MNSQESDAWKQLVADFDFLTRPRETAPDRSDKLKRKKPRKSQRPAPEPEPEPEPESEPEPEPEPHTRHRILNNDVMQLSDMETKFILERASIVDVWGGDWKSFRHRNFEAKTHKEMNFIQGSYTDMFFRNVFKLVKTGAILKYDVETKLFPVDLADIGVDLAPVTALLQDFVEHAGATFQDFLDYQLTPNSTYIFAILINAAKAVGELVDNNPDRAYFYVLLNACLASDSGKLRNAVPRGIACDDIGN